MNLIIKTVILDSILSIVFTLYGGGNFYSFLFFFIILLIPVIAIFVTIDNVRNSSKKLSTKEETTHGND